MSFTSFSTLPAAAQSSYAAAYTFTTFAGSSGSGSVDGVGSVAQFAVPYGVGADTNGNVYVADTLNHTIRKITPPGVVSTIAGFAGTPGSADGTNSAARFNTPEGVTVDSAGNVYIADYHNQTIRKVTPAGTNWVVTTIAGLATNAGSADGLGSAAQFHGPAAVAVDSATNVYVADFKNDTIRKITPVGTNWVVSTIAGSAGSTGSMDGTNGTARFDGPAGVTVDSAGNVYVADTYNDTIRKLTLVGTNWMVRTIAGSADNIGSKDGTNGVARFYEPGGIAVDSATNLYVVDTSNDTIRKLRPAGTNWIVTTWAGVVLTPAFVDGTGTNAYFGAPEGVAAGPEGYVYVADTLNDAIRKITSAGVVSTLAGGGSVGSADGTGGAARFWSPEGVAMDGNGNIYVADEVNCTIRQITSAGLVSTMAGLAEVSGTNDGPGSYALFSGPGGVAVDSAGNVYVADTYNHTIRKITPAGIVSTIAGKAGTVGSADGTNSAARFNYPGGIAVDSATNLYVADTDNDTIRKMTLAGTNWVVRTIAGLAGTNGFTDGTGTNAHFNKPGGIVVDSATNLYVADFTNDTIRKITLVGTNWAVSTIAGQAMVQGSADGSGTNAQFYKPNGIALDSAGNLYVADTYNNTIRKMTPVGTNWVVSTIGGVAGTFGSADGAGSAALFDLPYGLAVDNAGIIYVADTYNNTIRKGVFTAYTATNPVPYIQPLMNGQLVVTLLPPEANGQWRFPWEIAWRNSGGLASNLVAGNYPVEFRNLPGYLTISTNFLVAVANGVTTFVTNQYYPTLVAGDTNNGTLTVNIQPNSPAGSGWRFLGETTWRAPGSTATSLLPDIYFVEFEPVANYSKPASQAVQVYAGLARVISASYLLAASPPGGVLLPVPVPANYLSDLTDYPFGFNGQLQSDVGYGSGVAVQTNVVLTAAHLVFNDQTLSYVSQVDWYFQQEEGAFAPEPLQARGCYVLSGYAAQRTNDLLSGLGPDQSSPQSRNLDVAALYFLSPVAGGGYGGYLPSDASPNSWLTSTSLKMLVGYPVDGSLFGDASIVPGVMYQTEPQPYPLSRATDPVDNQQVYIATWFLSYPGNSGGPLYVQFNGYYYPAGVYLGTLFNGAVPYASAVRAIDSEVVSLITNAATLGDTGTNNTGGGVITIIPNQAISTSNPGYVQWLLGPAAAVQAGAGWRLQGDATYSTATNYIRAVVSTNAVVVQFKPIAGWNLPTNQTVTVLPGQITVYTGFYTVTNPVLVAGYNIGLGITGTTGTVYEIESRISLTSGTWAPVSTNMILSTGFNLVLPLPATNWPAAFYRATWLP